MGVLGRRQEMKPWCLKTAPTGFILPPLFRVSQNYFHFVGVMKINRSICDSFVLSHHVPKKLYADNKPLRRIVTATN